jgi:O-antigen biosynthesis protein
LPAALLVNGMMITQAERFDAVEYFHIELDSHDVIVTDSAPAESYARLLAPHDVCQRR